MMISFLYCYSYLLNHCCCRCSRLSLSFLLTTICIWIEKILSHLCNYLNRPKWMWNIFTKKKNLIRINKKLEKNLTIELHTLYSLFSQETLCKLNDKTQWDLFCSTRDHSNWIACVPNFYHKAKTPVNSKQTESYCSSYLSLSWIFMKK